MHPAAEWLESEQTFTTVIMAILLDQYGAEYLDWDPLTVTLQVRDDFGLEPTDALTDRINAGSALFKSNLFHLSLEAFSSICNVLNFGVTSSMVMLPADVDDILWCVTEARLLEGELYKETPFSHNISRFVGFQLSQEGIENPPMVLEFAEFDEIEQENLYENMSTADPVMAKLFWADQQGVKEKLQEMNRRKLGALFDQLHKVPLRSKDTDWIGQARDRLQKTVGAA